MSMSHLYGRMGDDEEEDGVEIEKFEVSEWDLANEFNPDRRRHRQTKEEATYGIWAEHDSDDERPSFGGKRYVSALLLCMDHLFYRRADDIAIAELAFEQGAGYTQSNTGLIQRRAIMHARVHTCR